MTTNTPLITQSDLQAIHRGNELNMQTLKNDLRALVKEVHKGNQQSAELIRGVTTKWKYHTH